MKFIINHPLFILAIILICLVGLAILISFMIKQRVKSQKNVSRSLIKAAKKAIRKNKIKSKLSDVYIFYGDFHNAKSFLSGLGKEIKLLESDFAYIAIDNQRTSILVKGNNITHIKKIKKKLNLQFHKLDICFDISTNSSYEEIQLEKISNYFFKNEIKSIIISFYSNTDPEAIKSFNAAIGKTNTFKLTKDSELDIESIETTTRKILSNSTYPSTEKYFSIVKLNDIRKIISKIHHEITSTNNECFVFLLLNKKSNITADTTTNTIRSPKNIILSIISILLACIFIINIFHQLHLRKVSEFGITKNISNESLEKLARQLKNQTNDTILLSSIYPENIKYHYINQQYADILAERVFDNFKKTKSLSKITAYLIFFEYMYNSYTDVYTEHITRIISAMIPLTNKQLLDVINYTSNSTKKEILQRVIKRVSILYKNDDINTKSRSENYLSTHNFNFKYLGISSTKRAKVMNQIYTKYLYRCTVNNAMPKLDRKFILPRPIANIFEMYEKNFKFSSKNLCDSSFINSVTDDISTVLNEAESDEKFDSFSSMLNSISTVTKILEENHKGISRQNKEASQKITTSLISYIVNSTTNSTYNKQELPLTSPIPKELYMEFNPNFYNVRILISPIYSKEYVDSNIITLNNKFKSFIKNIGLYNVKSDFLESIYRSSISDYNKGYIRAYENIIDKLNSDKSFEKEINGKRDFDLYLSVMSSKNSSFNSLIGFYHENTDLIPNYKASDNKSPSKIKKSSNNNQTNNKYSLYTAIDDHFRENNEYLASKSYNDYRKIFSQLHSLIKEQGYITAYQTIKKGYTPLKKVYSELSTINTPNNNLYLLLKKHLDVAIKTIELMAINNVVNYLDNSINLTYSAINDEFPLDFKSDKIVENSELAEQLGDSGYIYTEMNMYLKPILHYNKITDKWTNSDLTTNRQKGYVKKFNKVYQLNKLLWDKDDNPKAIKFEITPIADPHKDYTFFSLLINKNSFVNSLNIDYSGSSKVLYNWNLNDSTTIMVKLKNGDIAQKTYYGSWSILKAIKDANCHDNICTWNLKSKGKVYPVSFKIRSNLLKVIKW